MTASAEAADPVRDGMGMLRPARPSWIETVAIVVVCAVAFVVLTRTDRAAYERAMDRARTALAERAREAALRPPAERRKVVQVKRVTARTESLGDRGPIAIPLGGAWSAGTASTVADIAPRSRRTQSAEPALRRIVGPTVAIEETGRSDVASGSAPGATASPTPVAATATDRAAAARPAATAPDRAAATAPSPSILTVALAALVLAGVAMTLAGAALLRRAQPPVGVTR